MAAVVTSHGTFRSAAPAAGAFDLRASATSLWTAVQRWRDLARSRRALSRLSEDQLRDVGLDAEMAHREAGRPFWDASSQPR